MGHDIQLIATDSSVVILSEEVFADGVRNCQGLMSIYFLYARKLTASSNLSTPSPEMGSWIVLDAIYMIQMSHL